MTNEDKRLIWFYGKECPHCRALMPLVEKYQQDSNVKIEHLEVWHNEENAKLMRSHADKIAEACGGGSWASRPSTTRRPARPSAARGSRWRN